MVGSMPMKISRDWESYPNAGYVFNPNPDGQLGVYSGNWEKLF